MIGVPLLTTFHPSFSVRFVSSLAPRSWALPANRYQEFGVTLHRHRKLLLSHARWYFSIKDSIHKMFPKHSPKKDFGTFFAGFVALHTSLWRGTGVRFPFFVEHFTIFLIIDDAEKIFLVHRHVHGRKFHAPPWSELDNPRHSWSWQVLSLLLHVCADLYLDSEIGYQVLLSGLLIHGDPPPCSGLTTLFRQTGAGINWTYGHCTCAPKTPSCAPSAACLGTKNSSVFEGPSCTPSGIAFGAPRDCPLSSQGTRPSGASTCPGLLLERWVSQWVVRPGVRVSARRLPCTTARQARPPAYFMHPRGRPQSPCGTDEIRRIHRLSSLAKSRANFGCVSDHGSPVVPRHVELRKRSASHHSDHIENNRRMAQR